jgi:prolyl oligopeptidase
VPLLDMVRYHKFGAGRTWIPEYGDPDIAAEFAWLHAYSPYHHVPEGQARYPALLMLSADSDDRVDPMHARKFTAAVQHVSDPQPEPGGSASSATPATAAPTWSSPTSSTRPTSTGS